jgi:hypothetical protein
MIAHHAKRPQPPPRIKANWNDNFNQQDLTSLLRVDKVNFSSMSYKKRPVDGSRCTRLSSLSYMTSLSYRISAFSSWESSSPSLVETNRIIRRTSSANLKSKARTRARPRPGQLNRYRIISVDCWTSSRRSTSFAPRQVHHSTSATWSIPMMHTWIALLKYTVPMVIDWPEEKLRDGDLQKAF